MRILQDPPATGSVNMARDLGLLEEAIAGGGPAMRWYRWSEPTISLGYSQDDDPAVHPGLPRVRRLSGGGAILHDDEWTYSLTLPRSHPHAVEPSRLYRLVHRAIVNAAPSAVRFRGQSQRELDGAFLCFARGDANDLLVAEGPTAGQKVVGSAQRRRRGAVLQHGSILWRGTTAEGGTGLADLVPDLQDALSADAFRHDVSRRVEEALRSSPSVVDVC